MGDQSEKLQTYPWPELLNRTRREMLVDELLFTTGVTTLVAPSGEGKTTLALSIALTVATGGSFGGRLIKRRPVIWIAGEGQDDLRPMYEAWMKDHPVCQVPQGCWMEEPVDLSSNKETDKFISLLKEMPPALIVTDALADMIGDLNEDKSQDINRVYRNIWRVVRHNNGSFLIPHHSGWNTDRERGSTAIRAKSDIVVQIAEFNAKGGTIELKHNKRRGGAKLDQFNFDVKPVTVDGYSQPIPIVTGAKTDITQMILKQPIDEMERPARTLVELMVKDFQPNGATWTRLKDKSGMSPTSFKRAFNWATDAEWFVGGGKKGQPYNLNPNGCWRAAISASGPELGPRAHPYRGVDPMDPNLDPAIRSNGPNLDPSGPLAPNASCEIPDTTASGKSPNKISEGSKIEGGADGNGDSLLAVASEAIQHVDKKKRTEGA